MTIEIAPNVVQNIDGNWKLTNPLAQTGGTLFAVTTEWCGHCKRLKNNVKAAQNMVPFKSFYMDGDKSPVHEEKSRYLGVKGYPTVYYVGRNGILREYKGGTNPDQLASIFMNS